MQCTSRPLSVYSQFGGQKNKIALHLKRFFLSEERTTIVLSSRLGVTGRSLLQTSIKLCAVCFISILTLDSTSHVFSNQFLSLGLASQTALSLREDKFFQMTLLLVILPRCEAMLGPLPCCQSTHFQTFVAIFPSTVLDESHKYM